jgi:hypothetical protein
MSGARPGGFALPCYTTTGDTTNGYAHAKIVEAQLDHFKLSAKDLLSRFSVRPKA